MIINIKKNEYQYLIDADFINKQILDILSNFKSEEEVVKVELPDELVNYLREQLEDRLQLAGFDNNYDLTKEGFIIERLIDKLFIG